MMMINFYHDDHMMLMMLIKIHNDYSIVHFKSPHQVPVLRKVLSIKDVDCVPENQAAKVTQVNLIRNLLRVFVFVTILEVRFSPLELSFNFQSS